VIVGQSMGAPIAELVAAARPVTREVVAHGPVRGPDEVAATVRKERR
jgi:hypothetical protein